MGTRSILVVDDEPAIRFLLSAAFSLAGYAVETAANAAEAMELCSQSSFDVVLSDVRMPGMDGHQLARWVGTEFPQTRTVLMSGFDVACQECPMAGRCPLLNKPFRPAEAVAAVDRILYEPRP